MKNIESKPVSLQSGPPFYENWCATVQNTPVLSAYEIPLFSDSRFTGMITDEYGPYQFLNTIATHDHQLRAALVLRMDQHLAYQLDEEIKTKDQHYHGGTLADEAAALISMCLGVRVKAGSVTREFGTEGDPKGLPIAWDDHTPTLVFSERRGMVVPHARNDQRSLEDLKPLQTLAQISPFAAGVLVQSARLYQDALWVCESEPALSWLLLVSALETAAQFWRAEDEAPVEKLKAWNSDLEKILFEAGGADLVEEVATVIVPLMGATKKFVDFIVEFSPPAPQNRPWEMARVSWEKPGIKKIASQVYGYRSRALHGGTPFPAPMCRTPFHCKDEETDAYAEKPMGMASGTSTHKWVAKDTPLHLHTFESIARGALLCWWSTLPLNESIPAK